MVKSVIGITPLGLGITKARRKVNFKLVYKIYYLIQQFSYDFEVKTREQNRNNKRAKIERFDSFVERIQTRVGFGWLSKRLAEKTSCPKNFLEINRYFALTSYRNTIGQSNNAFFILRFSLAGKRGVYVWSFIHWVIKQITNSYRNHFSRSYENRSIPPRGVVLPALREFENCYDKVFRSYGTTLTARKFERLVVQKFER